MLGIIFTILGSTLAYYTWRGNVTAINFTVTKTFECSADMGGEISSNKLAPTSCTNSTYAIQREITVNPVINSPGMSIYMDLWLDVTMAAGLAASSNFKYALTRNPNSCTDNVIESGTFKGKERVELLSREPFTYQASLAESPDLLDTYYLYVWLDAAETDSATQGNNFTLTLGGECSQGVYEGQAAQMLISKANDASITTYSSGDTGEMYTFSQPETEQLAATTDYRYIGANPNNYIEFNDETWRIIGVFDDRIKIIKDTPIESVIWDYKKNSVGSSVSDYGSNDWTDSQLMYMLNPNDIEANISLKSGYTYTDNIIKDANNYIIYQNGCVPAVVSATTTSYSCAASSWSLNATSLTQVADATYFLGGLGISYDLFTNSSALSELLLSMTSIDLYKIERGIIKSIDSRSLNWNGKVGLMYMSDYYYTYANGVDDACYNSPFGCGHIAGITSLSWLFIDYNQWTINPSFVFSAPLHSDGVLYILDDGLPSPSSRRLLSARPVVYLKSDIQIQGTGTNEDKYTIVAD